VRDLLKKSLGLFGIEIRYRNPNHSLDLSALSGRHGTLVAGPFLGEFGWELMQWQGYVRQLAKFYDRTIVYGRESSRYFYRDFATEFRPVTADSWDTSGYLLHNFDYEAWARQFEGCDVLVADNRCKALRDLFDQQFVSFGEIRPENAFDMVVHARSIPKLEGNKTKWTRNWPEAHWDELCTSLPSLRIAAVGVASLSYAPRGTIDLRGVETETLCSILASSRICVGPSSGVMHLASLCRTPHLVWTSDEKIWGFGGSVFRYLRSWNPFATKVVVLDAMGWRPTPDYIRTRLLRALEESGTTH